MTKLNTNSIQAQLGPELWSLVEDLGVPLTEVTQITTLPSTAVDRAAFRLRLADGRIFKGRRIKGPRMADKIYAIAGIVGSDRFTKILARKGQALLEEWIDGKPLSQTSMKPEYFRQCGAILGQLHTREAAEEQWGFDAKTMEEAFANLKTDLEDLIAYKALTPETSKVLLNIAQEHKPEDTHYSFVHFDFCLENMIIDEHEKIFVIDNGTWNFAPSDYDLSRTWYRWPMNKGELNTFLQGYSSFRSDIGFSRHFPFWSIVTLVLSARFRFDIQTPDTQTPLNQLMKLLNQFEHGHFEMVPLL